MTLFAMGNLRHKISKENLEKDLQMIVNGCKYSMKFFVIGNLGGHNILI